MKPHKGRSRRRFPSPAQLKAAELELCSRGVFPPRGLEIGLYCFGAFFAGSIIGLAFDSHWMWAASMVLFIGASFHFGWRADDEYRQLLEQQVQETM